MSKSGSVVIAAEAALEYGFKDFNGKQPPSFREQKGSPSVLHEELILRLRDPPFLTTSRNCKSGKEAGVISEAVLWRITTRGFTLIRSSRYASL